MSSSSFLRVAKREKISPPPIWLMRQAGRYLPEYRATRKEAGSFLDLCFSPELATEVTLQPIRRFGFDAAILFSDILTIPWSLGRRVDFVEGVGPVLDPLTQNAELDALALEGLVDRLSPVLETIKRLRAELPSQTPLIGFVGAPWTLATYMIGGRSTPDRGPTRDALLEHTAFTLRMIDILAECCGEYLVAQIDAGAHAVKVFDSWASSVPDEHFERVVTQPMARIVEIVRAKHPATPIIGFPRAVGMKAAEYAQATQLDVLALDQQAPVLALRERLSDAVTFQGSLNPELLLGDLQALEKGIDETLAAFEGASHIFNLGHGVTPQSKIENVAHLVKYVREKAGA